MNKPLITLLAAGAVGAGIVPNAVADVIGVQPPPNWTRATPGTAFAEFDSFAGFVMGTGNAAPTAQFGITDASLRQDETLSPPGGALGGGTLLYTHMDNADWSLTGNVDFDIQSAILQVKESQGSGLLVYTATFAGLAPTSVSVFSDGGSTPDFITRYFWDLSAIGGSLNAADLRLYGPAMTFTAFDSFSLDLANTSPVPVPAAVWLLGSALVTLTARHRRA